LINDGNIPGAPKFYQATVVGVAPTIRQRSMEPNPDPVVYITHAQNALMAMSANGKQMMPFQWKQRIVVMRKGTPSATMIEELRFDATGQLQKTALSRPEEKRMGPLRARKVAEVKDTIQEVMQLAGRYASPQQLSQAIQKGEIWEGHGALRVQSRSDPADGRDDNTRQRGHLSGHQNRL
jgi:hypothetical protein